jgi:hypothetical protein
VDDLDLLLETIADLNERIGVDVSAFPEIAAHPQIPMARTLVREALDLVVRARRQPERSLLRERAAGAVHIAREAVDGARPLLAWARLRARRQR